MIKVGIIVPRFALAGVPLAQIRFAKALARRGCKVKLVIGYVDPQFQLPDFRDIDVEVWNIHRVRGMVRRIIKYLIDDKPDIIFAAEDHLNTIVLLSAILSRSSAKISGSSRVTPFDTYSNKLFTKGWWLKQITKAVMWRADVLTCVSEDMVEQYRKVFHNPPHVCVYNITKDVSSSVHMLEPVNHPWLIKKDYPVLVAAGKLAPWKGFSDLIKAVAIVAQKRTVRLLILGDGHMRSELQALIDNYSLGDYIQLIGYVNNPLKYFANSDIFVLSSHVEGLPNVLVEAMMCGCTPVSTDCPTGPREVLQNGKYGYLVPVNDPVAMASAIVKALDNPIPKDLLEVAVQPFDENRVIDKHFELLGIKKGNTSDSV